MKGRAGRFASRGRNTLRDLCAIIAFIAAAIMFYALNRYSFHLDLQPEAELSAYALNVERQTGRVIAITGRVTKSAMDLPPEALRAISPLVDGALQARHCRKSKRGYRNCTEWGATTAQIMGYAISPQLATVQMSASSRRIAGDGWRLEIWPVGTRYTIVASLDKDGRTLIPVGWAPGKHSGRAEVIDAQQDPTRYMADKAQTAYAWAWGAFIVLILALAFLAASLMRQNKRASTTRG
ncbi:MAG: hypothetical protein IPK59_14060 [Rhodospirillaceae bacterium]|nr:hypothetical protein [Rhodospirillaceae bacterium]